MATYNFGAMTLYGLNTFNGAYDTLDFTGVREATATNVSIDGYVVKVLSTDQKITLATPWTGARVVMPDGSILAPPGGSATDTGSEFGDHFYGSDGADLLDGRGGSDILDGGFGNDTIVGGGGADTLSGGGGVDTFVFAPLESGVILAQIDVITDFGLSDKLSFVTQGLTGGYVELDLSNISYSTALATANAYIAAKTADVVVVRWGISDVIVFADTRGDDVGADDAILLRRVSLDNISASNIAASTTTYGPPVMYPPVNGTAGDDKITLPYPGGVALGLGGNDSLHGSVASDTLYGGDGNDTLDGQSDRNIIDGGPGADVVISNGIGDTITLGAGADLILLRAGLQTTQGQEARVLDWGAYEDAIRFLVEGGRYTETTAGTFDAARSAANNLSREGYTVVSVQVGADVLVFGNPVQRGSMDSAIRLVGRTLDDVSSLNMGFGHGVAPMEPSAVPSAPLRATTGVAAIVGDMDRADVGLLNGKDLEEVTDTRVVLDGKGIDMIITGSGFATDPSRTALFGTVSGLALNQHGAVEVTATFSRTGLASSDGGLASVIGAIDADNASYLFKLVFNGADQMTGGLSVSDRIYGYGGGDVISGAGGSDTIFGGDGDDVIYAAGPVGGESGSTYLRGDDGNDWIAGGAGFDDINGNVGADTASGGAGDDWVVGGKDNDLLFGEAGADLVYGNIGDDTCAGGDGNDVVRGGQGNDVLFAGAGDDFVSGDKGNDTVAGGAGADTFHTFGDSGIDLVLDFHGDEGDRVQLDPGTQYFTVQDGYDVIINMSGGGQMTLVGVQLATLPPGWIFVT